jgi:pyrroloquinoline quinone biosynthesis protein D
VVDARFDRDVLRRGELKPSLRSGVRLRWDERENQYLLLSPERGLLLNPTAAEIVKLCTGKHTTEEIIIQVQMKFSEKTPSEIADEVTAFLNRMTGRGLLKNISEEVS